MIEVLVMENETQNENNNTILSYGRCRTWEKEITYDFKR